MNTMLRVFLVTLFVTTSTVAQSEELLSTTVSWNHNEFAYPKKGDAKVTVTRITLAENSETPNHCHPVPLFAYVLKGTLEVKTLSGMSTIIRAGEPVVEVMNTIHRGKSIGGDVELIAFYAGSTKIPSTVVMGSGKEFKKYCEY